LWVGAGGSFVFDRVERRLSHRPLPPHRWLPAGRRFRQPKNVGTATTAPASLLVLPCVTVSPAEGDSFSRRAENLSHRVSGNEAPIGPISKLAMFASNSSQAPLRRKPMTPCCGRSLHGPRWKRGTVLRFGTWAVTGRIADRTGSRIRSTAQSMR